MALPDRITTQGTNGLFTEKSTKKPIRERMGFKVPRAGVEPALPNGNKILSLACLPISPPGQPAQSLSRMQANQTLLHATGD